MSKLKKAKDYRKTSYDIMTDHLIRMENYAEELEKSNAEMLNALVHADEEICLVCKELNPHHKNCVSCPEREHRVDIIQKATG